jgi:hypothetical protein
MTKGRQQELAAAKSKFKAAQTKKEEDEDNQMAQNKKTMKEIKERLTMPPANPGDSTSSRKEVHSQFKMFGDENYVNKFGALKRGIVLMSYGRYNDAH